MLVLDKMSQDDPWRRFSVIHHPFDEDNIRTMNHVGLTLPKWSWPVQSQGFARFMDDGGEHQDVSEFYSLISLDSVWFRGFSGSERQNSRNFRAPSLLETVGFRLSVTVGCYRV
jgi:hypothetical protein